MAERMLPEQCDTMARRLEQIVEWSGGLQPSERAELREVSRWLRSEASGSTPSTLLANGAPQLPLPLT